MAYINPWDLLARRASGSRDPASVKDIPFAGYGDELSSQLPMINAIAGPMSPYGYEVSIGKGGKTPLPKEKVAEILASIGYNPEAESAQAQAHIDAMKNYEQAIASRPPQMDLSGLAAMSQYYNQDKKLTPYEKPADYQDQLVQAAKVQQLIGDARQKDAERKAQLLKAVSEFAPSEQALKFNRKGPPGGGANGLKETDIYKDVKDITKNMPKSASTIDVIIKNLRDEIGTFDKTDNSPLSKEDRAGGKRESSWFDTAKEQASYKLGLSNRPLALFDKLIGFQLRGVTGLTATEYEQEKARRIAAFTALGSNSAKRQYIHDTIEEMQSEIKQNLRGLSARPGVYETYRKQPDVVLPEMFDAYLQGEDKAPQVKGSAAPTQNKPKASGLFK